MENSNEILQKASRLFCKYGLKSVSMDDIARELSVSKKTIYQLVKDKAELVEKAINHIKFQQLEKMEAIAQLELNAVVEMLEVHRFMQETVSNVNPIVEFDMRKYYPSLREKLNREHYDRAHAFLQANIEKGIEQGLFRDNFNIELIIMLLYNRTSEMSEREEDLPLAWPEAVNQIMEYHLRGICTEKGLKVLEEHTKNIQEENKTHTDHDQE